VTFSSGIHDANTFIDCNGGIGDGSARRAHSGNSASFTPIYGAGPEQSAIPEAGVRGGLDHSQKLLNLTFGEGEA